MKINTWWINFCFLQLPPLPQNEYVCFKNVFIYFLTTFRTSTPHRLLWYERVTLKDKIFSVTKHLVKQPTFCVVFKCKTKEYKIKITKMLNKWRDAINMLITKRCKTMKANCFFSSCSGSSLFFRMQLFFPLNEKFKKQCMHPIFYSSPLSRISTETEAGKSDTCWTDRQFSAMGCKFHAGSLH